MVQLLREHGRPVRAGLMDSADQKWTFLFYFTEDGNALVACARLQRWVEITALRRDAGASCRWPWASMTGEMASN
ncbi:hypothetical protein [Streptomyces scabiei]|uniref:hypothetical protein n=1 Tax=Streptomyces scabiei TaxID=1930 RepID=UPI0029A77D78|nr:hypothetical protein [Streptomyces scabiei]MDX3522928.1 hypothetical protein [Streptomyces scabiei]